MHIHGGHVPDACVKNAMLYELVCPKPHPPAADCPGKRGKAQVVLAAAYYPLSLNVSLYTSLLTSLQADFCKK